MTVAAECTLHTFVTKKIYTFLEAGSHYVAQAGLKLTVLLPWPLKCWDYRCVPSTRH
jgi:hypothetical protein